MRRMGRDPLLFTAGETISSLKSLWSEPCNHENKEIIILSTIIICFSTGVGKTGAFVAICKLVNDLRAGSRNLDVYGTVHELRSLRTDMVQTKVESGAI